MHFPISAYGVIAALAALAAVWVAACSFRERGLEGDEAWALLGYGLLGGFLGAKLYYVLLHGDPGAFLSRGGLVWYGGLIGGGLAALWRVRRRRLPLGRTADALAPALALGHGIGHIGCFFSGDSYGLPSDLPWAVSFPRGAPPSTAGVLRREFGVQLPASIPDDQLIAVHPTMLYSALALLLLFGLLWALRRRTEPAGWLFGLYLVLSGLERFLVEFLRAKDDRFLWGLTTAQAVALVLMSGAALLLWGLARGRRRRRRSPPPVAHPPWARGGRRRGAAKARPQRSAPRRVAVVGAGPAGSAAALELARHGVEVTVYEQRRQPGGRFHGDLQGLENWTTDEDVCAWLARLGIRMSFDTRPTHEVTLVTPRLEPHTVRSEVPLLYLVRRGPYPGSLDVELARQAQAAGARYEFGRRVDRALPHPTIRATGPSATQAVVAGLVARTECPDQVVAIASDDVVPRGYAYLAIWDGTATLAAAVVERFEDAWTYFERTRAAFARLGHASFRDERRFGGRANIVPGRPLRLGSSLYVGEAAGLQDYFLGFGLRYAILSGHLAARALLRGEVYEELVEEALGPGFRAGIVNRFLYAHAGDRGYGRFIRWVARSGDVRAKARKVYGLGGVRRALYPIAVRLLERADGRRARPKDSLTGGSLRLHEPWPGIAHSDRERSLMRRANLKRTDVSQGGWFGA